MAYTVLPKNSLHRVKILRAGMEGEGIAEIKGKTVFVKNALQGETVEIKIISDKRTHSFAIVNKILDTSPFRVKPRCPVFGICGGCALQHYSYEAQLNFKRDYLKGLFNKSRISCEIDPVISSPEWNYRNKLSLPVRRGKDGKAVIGFFARGTHRVVEVSDCLLQPLWNKSFIELCRRAGFDGYDEESGEGQVRHVSVRETDGHKCVAVVTTDGKLKNEKAFAASLAELFDDFSLYINKNAARTNVIYGDEFRFVAGKIREVEVDGIKVTPHPAAFFQTNDYIRQKLYSDVARIFSDENGVVIDAYSGAGILSAIISRSAICYGVEINKEAHAAAKKLSESFGNMRPVNGDCGVILPSLIKEVSPSAVLLDPPRSGCETAVLTALNASSVPKIVYVSCNPATLVRDLSALDTYNVVSATPYDMFPQVAHIETLVTITKKT